jgi:hypothetical protein
MIAIGDLLGPADRQRISRGVVKPKTRAEWEIFAADYLGRDVEVEEEAGPT